MKISDLKFGDKFRFLKDDTVCVLTENLDKKFSYTYINRLGRLIHEDYTRFDVEVEPVGSVEQNKNIWYNSSERAPTINDCDNHGCLYICDGNKVERVRSNEISDWVGNEPYLWAPINKAPALPEPEYKLEKAEFPRDFNKVVYSKLIKDLGNLIGYDKANNKYPYIIRDLRNQLSNHDDVYVLEKP